MRSTRISLFPAFLLLTSMPILAQDMAPPKELAKYDKLLGSWEGEGTTQGAPGMPEMKWQSRSTYKKVMSGFWIQEDTRVTFGEAMPGAIVFRTMHGWDRENKRFVTLGVNNMGEISFDTPRWVDDKTLVVVTTGVENGETTLERWVTKIDGDKLKFESHRAVGLGEFGPYIRGGSKRSQTAVKPIDGEGSFMAPPADAMKKLAKIAGSYRLKGGMNAMPGAPAMNITARESMKMIWSGSICEAVVHGDPVEGMPAGMPTYESWGAIGWSAQHNCYISVSVDNMGQVGRTRGYWIGGDLVFTGRMMQAGEPVVTRLALKVGDKGLKSIVVHAIKGAADPSKSFWADYTREEKGSERD